MELNDIRVPRAIFPREDMHGRSKLGKSTLQLTVLRVPPSAEIKKYENTAFKVQEIPLEIQKFKKLSGGACHVLFLRKMTMFLRPITYQETN